MKKAYLVLGDGTVFEGERFGAEGETLGELVFTTGMCGYIETLTDPSYYGQIVMQTFPLIGYYGIFEDDFEGECCIKGYIVREWCDTPSNFRSQYDVDQFLKMKNIVGLCGIDTRSVTRLIREHVVMNAIICDQVPEDLSFVRDYSIRNAVESVTTEKAYVLQPKEPKKFSVTLVDYGAKRNIVRELLQRGCEITVVPATTTAEEILAGNPDGIMLSNGPGDPAENTFQIEQLRKLLGKKPIFGICLGHQLLGLADGGQTVKLKYGHRGVNQPVKEVNGTRTYITSQNHGYALVADSVQHGVASYVNANDGTNEGMDYPDLNAFSVQFHPEVCAGPKDTEFIFDKFIKKMGGQDHA